MPVKITDATPDTRPGDMWNCGNGHLSSQAALLLIHRNQVSGADAMQWLDDACREAGPDFCRTLLNDADSERMPF